MSQNQNKQSYAHGFGGGGVPTGNVGAMRIGSVGSSSGANRINEQRHDFNFAMGGGGGGEYGPSYWQQQQHHQQQYQQQQVFQQRQQQHQRQQQQQHPHIEQQRQLQQQQQQQRQQMQQRQQQHHQLQQRQQHHQLQQRQQHHQIQQRQHHLQQRQQLQIRQQQQQLQLRHQQLQAQQQQLHPQQQQQLQAQQQQRHHNTLPMKSSSSESNVQVPTIEMDELIIKTEPPDETSFGNSVDNHGSKNVSSSFNRSTYLNNAPFPHIKEEPSTSQQKGLNFPRRKLQTERAETLPICHRCKQVFLKKSTYMKHVRHSSCSILEYNFKCVICPMSFMSQEELQVHENVHRADQFFCQKYCGKYFDTLDLCEAHEFMFHDFAIFTCNVCNGNFKTRDVLFAHKTQHRHLNRFDCPICRRWFSTPGELHKHRLEAPFYCGKFYAEKEYPGNQTVDNNTSWNEANYNLQDCNIGLIEKSTSSNISSNQTEISKNNDRISNFHPDITIKSEPDFDSDYYPSPSSSALTIAPPAIHTQQPSTDSFFQNDPYSNIDFNSYSNANRAYNDFKNHYQNLERKHDNNFGSFSPPFIPATPSVSEDDAICCVPHCGKRKSANPALQFFKYPKDEKYLKQWLHNMKLIYNADESYDDYRICSAHFPKRVINLHSLCYWAVPTYHLGHDDFANIFHNREQSFSSVQCSVRGCESVRGKTNVKFFNFPSTESSAYMKWCQNTRLPLTSTEIRQICSRHFEEQCFGKLRLKNWALPTLHLGGFPVIHNNPRILFTEDKKCCLQHCRRKRSEDITLSFYGFPRDEQLLLRWCYNFRLDPNEYRGKFYKICSAHFVKDVIGTVKLLPGALPTLELGHNDPNIYTNELYPCATSSAHNTTSTSSNSSSVVSAAGSGGIQETPDTCSLPHCKRNRFADSVSMHTMPGRPEQFKKWCHNLKINPAILHKNFRVCSIHFEPFCIGGCMRPFAVPTLFLGHEDKNIHQNPKVIKKLSLRETCCVAVCRRNRERDRANLHSFPLHKPELLQKWMHNLQLPMPDGTRLFNDAICEHHFEDRCIQNKRLAKWALPTLLLGHEDDIIQLPTEEEVEEIMARSMLNDSNNGTAGGECFIETCKRSASTEENVKLYLLPDDEEVLEKWAHNLQQPDLKDYANTVRICNLHFESYCIGKKLHSWAIPTLNLPHHLEHIHENPSDMKVMGSLKAPNAPRCCVPSCRKMRIDGQVQLFRFPSYSKSIFKKWCHNLQLSLTTASSSHKRVCSTHFEPCVLTKRCPMPQALPTLNLNCPENYKIYQNPERLKLAKLRNERICCLPSCRKGKKDGVQLFLYPHNRGLLRKWAHNTKLKAADCTRGQLRLCSDHFEENCFGPSRLIPGAIPTLKLGHDDPDIFPNSLPEISEEEQQCAISGCGRKRAVDGVRLFRFPSDDEDLLWKWCINLKLNPIDCPQQRICNMHFEPDCIGPKGLHKWAIPTMLLGHNDTELQLHDNPKPEERVNPEPTLLKCCVTTCGKTRKFDDVMLNSFPKTPEIFRRWLHNLQMDIPFSEREKYKICNDHFETFCVGQARLKLGAVPTINLGHDKTENIYTIEPADLQGFCKPIRETTEKVVIKKVLYADAIESELEAIPKCSYPDCTASKTLLRDLLFDFPEKEIISKEWLKFINLDSIECVKPKLCGIHYIVVYEETAETRAELAKTHPELELDDDLQVLSNNYMRCCSSALVRSMQCCIPDCKTNSLSGIKLYQFPYQRDLKEKWVHNTGIELDENQRHLYKVCALHFESHCVTENQRLRPWAIPTLQLQHANDIELHQNPDLLALERRLLGPQSNKCCVPSCERHQTADENARLFNFPTEEALVDKWLHNLRVIEREKCPLYRICSWHFERRCISKSGRLRSWAIPTLKLKSNKSDDEENNDDLIQNPENPNAPSAVAAATKEPAEIAVDAEVSNNSDLVPIKGCKMKKNLDLIKCCVLTCRKSRLQHGVTFYKTPTDIKMMAKWAHILNLSILDFKKQLHICNQHFSKRCIDGKELPSWAVPTMNLGNIASPSPTFEKIEKIEKIEKPVEVKESPIQYNQYLPVCCVPKCGRRRTVENAMRTYGFPTNKNLLERWCTNLKMSPFGIKQTHRVCIYHFEEELRGKMKLKAGAVPALNLGHDEGPTYDNKELLKTLREKGNCSASVTYQEEKNMEYATASNHEDSYVDVQDTDSKAATLLDTSLEETNLESTNLEDSNSEDTNSEESNDDDSHSEESDAEEMAGGTSDQNGEEVCAVTGCTTQKSAKNGIDAGANKIQFFNFPEDINVLQKWRENLQMERSDFETLKICQRHFEPKCFGKRISLYTWAVPTLHLGLDELTPLPHDNSKYIKMEETQLKDMNIFKRCCIPTCRKTRRRDGVTLFPFPKPSQLLLRKWCHNTRQAFKRRQRRRICSDHFEKFAMENGKLRPWALPTLQLGHAEPIYENPSSMLDKCCIQTCESNENTHQLFSFPKRSSQLRKWAHNTKQDAYLAVRQNYKVCSLHFEPTCIGSSGLNFGAIPTLELGPQAIDDADEQENYANEVVATRDVPDVSCSIANCGRKLVKDGIILFPFPKDVELLEKWCHNLKLEAEHCEDLYICNMHFETGLIRKYKLMDEAIPTLLLGHDDQSIELIKPPESSNTAPVIRCSVPNCSRSKPKDDVQMMGFPKNLTLLRKWLHNLKIKPNLTTGKVCSDHFEEICMAASRIKYGSIPTLNLGHDDSNIYSNNKKTLLTADERRKNEKCFAAEECNVSKILQMKLFDMPKLESTFQRWLKHFGVEWNDNIDTEPQVCAIHFMDAFEKVCGQNSNDNDAAEEADPLADSPLEEEQEERARLTTTYEQISRMPRLRLLMCSVPGCRTKFTNNTIRLIRFPTNPEICAKWCHNTQVTFDEERRYLYKTCSLHFEDYCYANTRLHPWAIPTLKLPPSDEEIYQNPEPEESQPELCCVPGCRPANAINCDQDESTDIAEKGDEVTKKLFSFPVDETLFQKWCHNLDLPAEAATRAMKICGAHFENYCIGKVLRPWAIPTLKLSRDPATLYTNPEVKDLPTGRLLTCCVRDCLQQRDDEAGIKLFALPLKPELRQKWLHNLGLLDHADDWKSYRVCSLHFERYCVGKRIHNWAIPTLRLCQSNEVTLFKNPRTGKKKLNTKCCLKHCRKSRHKHQVRLYNFPVTEPQVLKKWLHNLKLDSTSIKRKLCSSHFEKICFYKGMKRLHPWAIPTLELGHKNVIFENPKGNKLKLQLLPTAKEKCALASCESKQKVSAAGEPTIRFFGFPCAEGLLHQWCDNLKLDVAEYRSTKQRLCEQHFVANALNGRKLLPGAVPTINLGHQDVIKHENPKDMNKYRCCSLTHCRADMSDEVKLFDFPLKNEALMQQWCENLQLKVEECTNGAYVKVCNAHFVPEAIGNNKPKPNAVPTLNSGHSKTLVHDNPTETLEFDCTKQCDVEDCVAMLETNAQLYDFPKKPKRILRWCENLKINISDSTQYRLCGQHFDSSCFDPSDLSLLEWALPTLNLGHSEQLPYACRKRGTKLLHEKNSKCCVATCQSTSNARFYRFPTINWLISKWCYNLRRPEEGVEKLKICSKHFEKHCLGLLKPRPWAIPTLNLGHTGDVHQSMKIHKYHPEEKACGEMKFVRSNYCAIVSCLKSKQDGVQLYRYPAKGPMLHKWAHNCRHRAYQAARYIFRICREHFEDQCISATSENRLRPGAIPTLKLGHDDIDIHPHEVIDCATPSTSLALSGERCSVPNCGRNKLMDNVRIFRFPKDAEMISKWFHNLRLDMSKQRDAKNMRICNMHFEERCLGLKKCRLLMRAVPTLMLGHNDVDDIHQNPESFERPEKVIHCCVQDCGRIKHEDDVSLFCFPKCRRIFDQWVQNIRLDIKPTSETYIYLRVCSMHFEEVCYVGGEVRKLLMGAVPTLNLGHNEKDIHHVKPEMLSTSLSELRKRQRGEDSTKHLTKRDGSCCVPKCNGKEYHIYALPQHATLEHMWYEALGLQQVGEESEKQFCAIHYKLAYMKTNKQLLTVADESFAPILNDLKQLYDEISSSSRIRNVWCSVPGCIGNTITGDNDMKLHAFPNNVEVYEKWAHNTQVEVDEQQRYLFKVCSLHFEARCMKEPPNSTRRLHPWALPTLNLPLKDVQVIIQNPSPDTAESKNNASCSESSKTCCIATCVNAKKTTTEGARTASDDDDDEDEKPLASIILYKFPRDVHLFRKWLYNTQMDANDAIHARICGRHFEPACIAKGLSPWALPTLHLGHEKPNIHQNPKEEISNDNPIENNRKTAIKEQAVENSTLKINKISIDSKQTKELLRGLLKKEEKNPSKLETLLSPKWDGNKISNTSTPKEEIKKRPIIVDLHSEPSAKISKKENLIVSPDTSAKAETQGAEVAAEKTVILSDDESVKSVSVESVKGNKETLADDEVYSIADDDENESELMGAADDEENESEFMAAADDDLLTVGGSTFEGEDNEMFGEEEFNDDDEMEDDDPYETPDFDNRQFVATKPNADYNDEVFYSLGDEPAELLYATPTEDIQACRIAGCTSRSGQPNIVLHKFPTNALLRNRWLHNTNVKWDEMRPWAYKICSLHFEPQFYTSMTNRLTAYAIPTLNLGHTRPEKIYDSAVATNFKPSSSKSAPQKAIKLERPDTIDPVVNEAPPSSGFNFKITAIESISMDAKTMVTEDSSAVSVGRAGGANDDDLGMESDSNSVSSTEYRSQQYSDGGSTSALSGSRASNTTNLICSIPSCQRKTNQDYVQLHMLPKDAFLLKQWCHNCKLAPSPHELYTTRVCSHHFEDYCFTRSRRQLKLGSLPTLNLGHNDEIFQNPRQPSAPLVCCVDECGRRKEDNARLFRFPTDKRTLSKWLHNLQMEFNAARPWEYNVCEKHFEDYCFGKVGSIMPWAVPTLELGSKGRELRDLRLNERPIDEQINDDDLFIMPNSTPTAIDSQLSLTEPILKKDPSANFKPNNVFYEQHFTLKKNLLQPKDDMKITTPNCYKCIVPTCGVVRGSDFRMQMFALPKEPQLRQKWIFNMKLFSYTYNPENPTDKICVRHFEKSVIIGPNVLKKSAVPTLNLGHNDRNIYVNVDVEPKYLNQAYGSAADALQAMAKIKVEPFEEQQRMKADATLLQFQQFENQFNTSSYSASDMDSNSSFTQRAIGFNITDSIKCFLKHCKRRRRDGVKLFRFPREKTLQTQWEHNLKMMYDDKMRERLFLCSTHFEPHFMGRKFLMKGAVPTLNLGHNDTNIFRPDSWALSEESVESTPTPSMHNGAEGNIGSGSFNTFTGLVKPQPPQNTAQVACCVPGCGLKDTGSDNVLFFAFPSDEKYARIWQQRFRINYDSSRRIKLRVCNIHFEPHLICRKSLVQHAVPTLNLPPPLPHVNKQLTARVVTAPIVSPSSANNTCNVTGCHKNALQDNVKLFSKFPDDFELFTKWCYNLKIDPRKYVDGKYNVCSSHFEPYCIGGHSLRLWAVPTLNLGHNDANIHQVKRPAEMETKCCLPHCGRRRSTEGVTFYNFPKGDLYKLWCKILNIDELLYRNTDKKICSAHFTADCFNGSTLKVGVKPTLHLRARPALVPTAAAAAAAAATSSTPTTTTAAKTATTVQHPSTTNQQIFKIHDTEPNMPSCFLEHCSNNSTATAISTGAQFFGFPDKRYLCMKWCHNLRINYSSRMLYDKKIYKICTKHFESSCIHNGKLHTESVPTLELGHSDVNIFQNSGSFSTLTNDSSSLSSTSTGVINAMGSSGGGGSQDFGSSLMYVKEEIMDQDEMEPIPEDVGMLNNFTAAFFEPEM